MFPHHPSVYTNSAYRFLYIMVLIPFARNFDCILSLETWGVNYCSNIDEFWRRYRTGCAHELVEDTLICAEVLRAWIQSCLCGTDANVFSYPGYKASVSIWQQNDSVFINNNFRVTIFVFQIFIIKSYMIGFHSSSITKPTETVSYTHLTLPTNREV